VALLRREPRSVYRVYAEEEYLDGQEALLSAEEQQAPSDPALHMPATNPQEAMRGSGRLHPAALLAAGLLAAVAIGAVAIVLAAGGGGSRRASPASVATRRGEPPVARPRVQMPSRRRRRGDRGMRSPVRPRSTESRRLGHVIVVVAAVPPAATVDTTWQSRLSSAAVGARAQREFGFER
jgi:hypothetical protein